MAEVALLGGRGVVVEEVEAESGRGRGGRERGSLEVQQEAGQGAFDRSSTQMGVEAGLETQTAWEQTPHQAGHSAWWSLVSEARI